MSTLSWIIAVSLAGGALSVLAAAALSIALGAHRISMLISYAIGALLGAAFLEILPHALEHGDKHQTTATVLFGILAFLFWKSWSFGDIAITIIVRRTMPMRQRMTTGAPAC